MGIIHLILKHLFLFLTLIMRIGEAEFEVGGGDFNCAWDRGRAHKCNLII